MDNNPLGKTIKDAIRASGLKQKEFAQKYNFNPSSLSNWISGKQTPRQPTLIALNNAFREEGLSHISHLTYLPSSQEAGLEKTDVLQEINFYKSLYKNFSILLITDNLMAPIASLSDYVGGIDRDPMELSKEKTLCIVELFDGFRAVRYVSNSDNYIYINTHQDSTSTMKVDYKNIKKCSPIFWHRLPT